MGAACGKAGGVDEPKEYDKAQREWAQSQRVDEEINSKRRQIWESEGRANKVNEVFRAMAVTVKPGGEGAESVSGDAYGGGAKGDPTISVAKLGGIVKLCLEHMGELYSSPSQNRTFLRIYKPGKGAGRSSRDLNAQYPEPPADAVFVRNLRDMYSVAGPWCREPRDGRVSEHRFGIVMELLLWQASTETFAAVLDAAPGAPDDDTPTPREAGPPPAIAQVWAGDDGDASSGVRNWTPPVLGRESDVSDADDGSRSGAAESKAASDAGDGDSKAGANEDDDDAGGASKARDSGDDGAVLATAGGDAGGAEGDGEEATEDPPELDLPA